MKCLSISQPFAELIATGKKTIELRSWNTRFRGEFLVHAPLRVRDADCKRLRVRSLGLVTGAIIGKAELYNVIRYESATQIRADYSRHHAGRTMYDTGKKRYGFELRNAIKFRAPVKCAGKLGFFENPESDPSTNSIISDILNDEHMYGLVGHH